MSSLKIKLFKGFLTIPEVAAHVSTVVDAQVGEADILAAALNGALTLSAYLVNGAPVRVGRSITHASALEVKERIGGLTKALEKSIEDGAMTVEEMEHALTEAWEGTLSFIPISGSQVIAIPTAISLLGPGVYDLPMVGNERYSVLKKHQNIAGGAPPGLATENGVFVLAHDGGFCQLHRRDGTKFVGRELFYRDGDFNYWTLGELPADSDLVVRAENLNLFLNALRKNSDEAGASDGDNPENALVSRDRPPMTGDAARPGEARQHNETAASLNKAMTPSPDDSAAALPKQATDSVPPSSTNGAASATNASEVIGNDIIRIQIGRNPKEVMDAYIESRARHIYANQGLYGDDKARLDTKEGIAAIIAAEVKSKGYRSDRDKLLNAGTIVKAIPNALTGGRARNGKKRK